MEYLLWLVLAVILGYSLGIIVINISDKFDEYSGKEDDLDA